MSEWQRGTIGELAKGYRGVTYSAGQLREFKAHDTVTLLRSNNISGGQLNFGDVQIVSERLVSDDQLLTPGDIAVCMSNGSKALVGKSAQLVAASDERFTVGAFCSVFRPQPSANSRFVAYAFQSRSYRSNLDLALAGTAINNLRNADVEAFACDIPPIEEQSRIAQILDTLDTAIRETEALIDKLKAVKQGLLHDLLTRGIDANGQLRPPQSEAPQLYKESPLGWIPREWEVVTLESVSSAVTSGSRDWARFYSDSGALFVRIGNLTREHINFRYDSVIRVQPPVNGDGQRTKLEPGDILVSITADLGIIGVVPEEMGEAYINQHIALVRPNIALVNPRFVGHYLAGPIMQAYISKLNDAGAKAGLNLPTIRNLPSASPSQSEQDQIAARLDEMDNRIQNAMTEAEKLSELKSGLMDDLLTGRVRVSPLLESVQQAAGQTGA